MTWAAFTFPACPEVAHDYDSQSLPGDVAARAGVGAEFIALAVAFIAPRLVSPLAAVWKRWRKTQGPDTRTIIKWLTALIVGLGGFLLGLYGYDLRGILNAFMAAVLTYFKTVGEYERDVQVQVKAQRQTDTKRPADLGSANPLDGPTGLEGKYMHVHGRGVTPPQNPWGRP